jgi:hypothetical protein
MMHVFPFALAGGYGGVPTVDSSVGLRGHALEYAAKGCCIRQLFQGPKPELVKKSRWVIHRGCRDPPCP